MIDNEASARLLTRSAEQVSDSGVGRLQTMLCPIGYVFCSPMRKLYAVCNGEEK